MGDPTPEARAEGLISRGLANHLLQRDVITRIGPDDLFHEGEADGIDIPTWDKAVNKLLDAGRILAYKVNDLPDTLPLAAAHQTGYTTREHLLGLLKKANPNQVEEIRDFLEYEGVDIPASSVRVPVTAAQKKRIDNAVRKLNEVRDEVADRNPDNRVAWYLDASGNFNLMVEPAGQMEPDQQYIAHDIRLRASGAGDW
ncbi:hypothetical protein [Pseudarthrobacter sp. BIM B-2242]|uniref:hypothetical protein n=1 Tax=Pseudarthrobacter sp. BIM B-2242 TaxID=2772401 RepID=UPI00168BA0A9|nr:hypothetical protein [Pseudarthrobacter sp. BIM B-2242]QOD05839.1 hypothetical protein IDT60_22885 [Pseudarthrobacter sp. BIM B-2242]